METQHEYTTPQDVIDAYLAECRRTGGDARADEIRLWYNPTGGWYHLRSPYKTGPNSYTPSGVGRNFRVAELKRVIERLRRRPDFDTIGDTPTQAQEQKAPLPRLAAVALNLIPLHRELNRLLALDQGASAVEVSTLAVMCAGLAQDVSEAIEAELALDTAATPQE